MSLIETKECCAKCNKQFPVDSGFSVGYGENEKGERICYECIAIEDEREMCNNQSVYMYFQHSINKVSNWPGSFKLNCQSVRVNNMNYVTVYFDGDKWHGKVGDNSELIKLKRYKRG